MTVENELHLATLVSTVLETYVSERTDEMDGKDLKYISMIALQHTESALAMLYDWFDLGDENYE